MTRLRLAAGLTLSALSLTAIVQANTTWPGLRGPSHDGAVHDAQLFDGESAELTIGWKRDLGSGYSVVAVDSRRLVTAFQAGAQDKRMQSFPHDDGQTSHARPAARASL